MLKRFSVLPVDELYLNFSEDGGVSRIGVNNGIIVDESFANPRTLTPVSTVRIVGALLNLPLILSAGNAYEVPVEIGSAHLLAGGASSIRELVIKSRNGHRSLPNHHPLGYRRLEERDLYMLGHTYKHVMGILGIPLHKFHKDDLDFVIDTKYIDKAAEQHVMSDTFTMDHAAEFCAIVMDPRLFLGPGGQFNYHELPQMLGFGSIELACQLTRKFIELHGTAPLPCDSSVIRSMFKRVTGQSGDHIGHPVQLLSARILHGILTAPLDNLGVTLKGSPTRLARDSEVVRQRLHWLADEWLHRLYGEEWTDDEYSPSLFSAPDAEGGDSDV